MEKLNTPELRFPEFEGEWNSKSFGKLVTNKSKKIDPSKEENNYKCIELEHLSQNTAQLLGYIDSCDTGSIKNYFNRGDVLFGKLRPYLRKFLLAPFDGVCSSEIWVLKGVGVSNDFLFTMIQTNKFINLANQSSGSKMPRADWSVITNSLLTYPTLPEQQKIASFFTSIDKKIELLKKKHSLLEQYKKGVMQKIFAQKIRFKDSDGNDYADWEEKKLGEVFYSVKGQGLSKDKVILTGKNECILYGELYTTYAEIIYEIASKTNQNEGVKSMKNDLLIPCSTTTTGIDLANVTALNKDNVLLGGDITILRTKFKIYNVFFAYYLSNFKKYDLARFGQGTTIVHLYFSHFKMMKINIPSIQEQTKIANFLSSIDKKIEKVQLQIDKAEEWKKGLLGRMFC